MKSICLLNSILSLRSMGFIPIEFTWNSTTKWRSRKKKSNIDGHAEIYDKFLITSSVLLGICLGDYYMHSQPSAF